MALSFKLTIGVALACAVSGSAWADGIPVRYGSDIRLQGAILMTAYPGKQARLQINGHMLEVSQREKDSHCATLNVRDDLTSADNQYALFQACLSAGDQKDGQLRFVVDRIDHPGFSDAKVTVKIDGGVAKMDFIIGASTDGLKKERSASAVWEREYEFYILKQFESVVDVGTCRICRSYQSGNICQQYDYNGGRIRIPEIIRMPKRSEISKYTPNRAERMGVSGKAMVECEVDLLGTPFDCDVLKEDPEDFDFGRYAIYIAKMYKLKPQEIDGVPSSGGVVSIPVLFSVPPQQ